MRRTQPLPTERREASRISKFLASSAAAVAIAATAGVGVVATAEPAAAATTYCRAGGARGSCPVFAGPSSSRYYFEAPNYTPVRMICWTDAQWYSVNYRSNRWFKVSTPYTGTAWMHSSEVYNQTRVPHC